MNDLCNRNTIISDYREGYGFVFFVCLDYKKYKPVFFSFLLSISLYFLLALPYILYGIYMLMRFTCLSFTLVRQNLSRM